MMKLTHNTASPFVRKAMVTAIETGVIERLQLVPTDPWNPDDPLPGTNPLGKVPTLVDSDGRVFAGSALVCEYLDSLSEGRKVYPSGGEERWRALRLHSMADGALEASVARFYEHVRRPTDKIWDGWIDRQNAKIYRTADVLDGMIARGELAEEPTIGELTLACALGYFDFRLPDLGWRDGRPALAGWYEAMLQRPSIAQTMPAAPQ